MTISNLRSIKTVANFNTLIVILQMGIVAVIVGLIIYGVSHGEGAGTLPARVRSGLKARTLCR
jgi:amino acid transporter